MDANDCILSICISYKEKSFTIQSENIITIDNIKEKLIKEFNLKKEDKVHMKLLFKNGEKEVFINTDDDIIIYADNSDVDNPKLNLNLLIDGKKEEKENEDSNVQHEESISSKQRDNNDIKKINSNNYISSRPKGEVDKYDELKKLIENLSNEIKALKDEQINRSKKMEANNLNLKNEIEQNKKKIEEIYNNNNNILLIKNELNNSFKEEFSRIREENKNYETLLRKNEKEINEFKSQISNIMNSLKKIDEIENNYKNYIKNSEIKFAELNKRFEEKYNNNNKNSLPLNLSGQINSLEEKIKKIEANNSSMQKELNELIKSNKNKFDNTFNQDQDNSQQFPKLDLYKNDSSTNFVNSDNLNTLNNNIFNGNNEINIRDSLNADLFEENFGNKDNNILLEELEKKKEELNGNQNVNLDMEKINELKSKYPELKDYPNHKLQELIIDSGENFDQALPKLILRLSLPNGSK